MKLVIIESPFMGDKDLNIAYARKCLKHSLLKGESPIASHLLYPQVLNDETFTSDSSGSKPDSHGFSRQVTPLSIPILAGRRE